MGGQDIGYGGSLRISQKSQYNLSDILCNAYIGLFSYRNFQG
jgi:hypothetical protein